MEREWPAWSVVLVPGCLAFAVLVMVPMLVADNRLESRRLRMSSQGVCWRWRNVAWSSVTGIRREGCQWVLCTTRGDLALPDRLRDVGRLVAEVRRRTTHATTQPAQLPDGPLLSWLGLAPGYRRQVYLCPDAWRRTARLRSACVVAAFLLTAPFWFAAGEALVFAALVGAMVAYAVKSVFARPDPNLAWFDEEGIEFETSRRVRLAWHQLLALRDEGDRFTLITTEGDLTILADGEAAAAVRHTADQVLAALEASGGWAATAGDASLSPAERLTGEQERGLSQAAEPNAAPPSGR